MKGGDLAKRWEMGTYDDNRHERRRVRHAIVEGRASYKKHLEQTNIRPERQWGDVRARVAVPGKHMGYQNPNEVRDCVIV